MALDLLMLLLGGGALYFGAEWLVEGASKLAASLGVSPLLIGLTVVAYGTSAPEMAVSVISALDTSDPEGGFSLALGNVIGSNIANLGLVLGITALLAPPSVPAGLVRREIPWLCGTTFAVTLALWDDRLTRFEGLALLVGAAVFTGVLVRSARAERRTRNDSATGEVPASPSREKPASVPYAKLIGLTAVGLVTLPIGGSLFVNGAVGMATAFGVDKATIGLTIVAFGTSLPELSASIVAALKGHSEMAVGNVVGSNLFNLLLVLGATAVIQPLSLQFSALYLELTALGALTLVGALMMSRARKITRAEGMLLGGGYVGFVFALLCQS